MSRLKAVPNRKIQPARKGEPTLAEALDRIDDPALATSLAVFYAELARAQIDGDRGGAEYARRAIAEAMRGLPDGPIDMPLLPLLHKRAKKRRR